MFEAVIRKGKRARCVHRDYTGCRHEIGRQPSRLQLLSPPDFEKSGIVVRNVGRNLCCCVAHSIILETMYCPEVPQMQKSGWGGALHSATDRPNLRVSWEPLVSLGEFKRGVVNSASMTLIPECSNSAASSPATKVRGFETPLKRMEHPCIHVFPLETTVVMTNRMFPDGMKLVGMLQVTRSERGPSEPAAPKNLYTMPCATRVLCWSRKPDRHVRVARFSPNLHEAIPYPRLIPADRKPGGQSYNQFGEQTGRGRRHLPDERMRLLEVSREILNLRNHTRTAAGIIDVDRTGINAIPRAVIADNRLDHRFIRQRRVPQTIFSGAGLQIRLFGHDRHFWT